MASTEHFGKSTWMLTLVSLAVVVGALYLAKGVLAPLTLAVMLSFLLAPMCDWLERRRLGRIPAVLLTAVLAFVLLGAGTWSAALQMIDLAPRIPEYQSNIQKKLNPVSEYLTTTLGRVTRTTRDLSRNLPSAEPAEESIASVDRASPVRVVATPTSPLEFIGAMFGSMLAVMGSTGVIIVLVIFILVRREDLRDRFIRLVGRGRVTTTTQTLEDAATRVRRYLTMQLVINITFGVPIAIGLYLIGVPNAILWGILATALRFIPYIGAWTAAAPPIGLSLAISTNWIAPILTIGLFVALELFISNVMEPWLYGKNTGVSSVAILVATVFWTWLWGPVGLLLAVPLTVCLLVVGKHVPQLSFLDTLLGNEPVFELKKRVYQRLLAGDQEEATALLVDHLAANTLEDAYDSVLIPALASVETHWHRGDLDEVRHDFMFQSLREIVEELGDREPDLEKGTERTDPPSTDESPIAETQATSPRASIVCLPARDEVDEIAALMLAQVFHAAGCTVQTSPASASAVEVFDLIKRTAPDVVCVSAMPPAAVAHSRHLCKQLRARFPSMSVVVGLWDAKDDLGRAKERIGCGLNTHLVATFADAQLRIAQLLHPGRQATLSESNSGAIVGRAPAMAPVMSLALGEA